MNMTATEKLALFESTFTGLTHIYGTYDPATGRSWQVKQPVTRRVLLDHLKGIRPYGVYLLRGHLTSAVVADFDDHDANPPLEFLHRLRHLTIPACIEASKSKGFHVWCFLAPGVEARKARALFRHILGEMERPNTEIFPKQDTINLQAGENGNFINAPLFGSAVTNGKTVFLNPDNGLQPYPNQWEILGNIDRVTASHLDDVLEANEIEIVVPCISEGDSLGRVQVTGGMPPCARRMLEDGVGEFQRVACFRLAVQLRRVGMPYDLAVVVLLEWATKNTPMPGKQIITETEVKAQTAQAYLKEYRGHGCEEPGIVPYCDPTCPIYARRMDHGSPTS